MYKSGGGGTKEGLSLFGKIEFACVIVCLVHCIEYAHTHYIISGIANKTKSPLGYKMLKYVVHVVLWCDCVFSSWSPTGCGFYVQ